MGIQSDAVTETMHFIFICNVLFYKLRSSYTGVDYFILMPFGIFEVVCNLFRMSTSDFPLWTKKGIFLP